MISNWFQSENWSKSKTQYPWWQNPLVAGTVWQRGRWRSWGQHWPGTRGRRRGKQSPTCGEGWECCSRRAMRPYWPTECHPCLLPILMGFSKVYQSQVFMSVPIMHCLWPLNERVLSNKYLHLFDITLLYEDDMSNLAHKVVLASSAHNSAHTNREVFSLVRGIPEVPEIYQRMGVYAMCWGWRGWPCGPNLNFHPHIEGLYEKVLLM